VAPSVKGDLGDFDDWFDLVQQAGRLRRFSIQVGAIARNDYKTQSGEIRPKLPIKPQETPPLLGRARGGGGEGEPAGAAPPGAAAPGPGPDGADPGGADPDGAGPAPPEGGGRARLNPNSSAFVPGAAAQGGRAEPGACAVCGEPVPQTWAGRAEHLLEKHVAAATRAMGSVLQDFISNYVMLSRAIDRDAPGDAPTAPARRSSSASAGSAGSASSRSSSGPSTRAAGAGGSSREGASPPPGGEGDRSDGEAKPTVAPYAKSQALDDAVAALMERLKHFQNRKYEENPRRAQERRRFVVGLKEVVKAVRLRKVALVVMANNVESAAGAAGFDEQVAMILAQAEERAFPVVYALGLKRLGRLMQFRPSWRKPPPKTTAVAVLDLGGAEDLAEEVVRQHRSALALATGREPEA